MRTFYRCHLYPAPSWTDKLVITLFKRCSLWCFIEIGDWLTLRWSTDSLVFVDKFSSIYHYLLTSSYLAPGWHSTPLSSCRRCRSSRWCRNWTTQKCSGMPACRTEMQRHGLPTSATWICPLWCVCLLWGFNSWLNLCSDFDFISMCLLLLQVPHGCYIVGCVHAAFTCNLSCERESFHIPVN